MHFVYVFLKGPVELKQLSGANLFCWGWSRFVSYREERGFEQYETFPI